ncbi:hypothetical protein VP1G_08146 [Cytospora mali]|uniref:Nephrocystin 3-like N-terminal domain-containing protein n=1 Tax=Cytospora mali TaxID=578113 RepID=A0A194VAS4_CYTMA|nr:hypothetical protein VP1G_08146 [Valsa mali var. pyri (nom. inval.)]
METWETESPLSAHDVMPPRPLAEPVAALRCWDSLFTRAMESFKVKHADEPESIVKLKYSIRDKKDWTGVFEQLETAKKQYCKEDQGFKPVFRKVYRKFAEHVAQPLLGVSKFVPDVDYVTPVLGAVQVLLEAAKKAATVREVILRGFDDIEMTFSQIELFTQIYPGDENVTRASVDLIVATFHAIESVISFFIKSIWRRATSATLKKQDYQKPILDSLQDIKSQSESLIREADNSEKYEMSRAMRTIMIATTSWKSAIQQIRQDQIIIRQELKNGFKKLLDEFEANQTAQNEHLRILASTSRSPSPAPPVESGTTEQHITPQELLEWINIPDLASQDLEQIEEKRRTRVPAQERARAEQLIQVSPIQEWLRSPRSSQLLVHGNYDMKRYISGLSLFCTTLIQSVAERAPRFLHLTFFCGLHTDSITDRHTGGLALIQSFICQLLCQFDFSRKLPTSMIVKEMVQKGDIHELCGLFKQLVNLLPNSVVLVCLIDGILYYEREEFLEDMGHVLVTILRISSEQSTKATVKVLITSPTRTTEARKPFRDDLIVSMDALALPGMVASKGRLERQLKEGQDDLLD